MCVSMYVYLLACAFVYNCVHSCALLSWLSHAHPLMPVPCLSVCFDSGFQSDPCDRRLIVRTSILLVPALAHCFLSLRVSLFSSLRTTALSAVISCSVSVGLLANSPTFRSSAMLLFGFVCLCLSLWPLSALACRCAVVPLSYFSVVCPPVSVCCVFAALQQLPTVAGLHLHHHRLLRARLP